eukprot:m.446118 g.446118  ORF g.446118 m.446118 type:complete len:248 (-) comp20307_c4_seq3:2910-3653(-)
MASAASAVTPAIADNAPEKSTHAEVQTAVVDIRVAARYRLLSCIGRGSFGTVYQAEDLLSQNKAVACKLEPMQTRKRDRRLKSEFEIYQDMGKGPGIAAIHWFGQEGEFNVLVMEHFSCSLLDYLRTENVAPLEQATLESLGVQLLDALQFIHGHGYIHRDVQPGNLLLGGHTSQPKLCVVDFGLAKRFLTPTMAHLPPSTSKANSLGDNNDNDNDDNKHTHTHNTQHTATHTAFCLFVVSSSMTPR